MSMREYARKVGGEKAVAAVEKSQRIQRELFEKLAVITEGATEGVTDKEEEQLILVSLCEAMSAAFANVVAVSTSKMGHSRAEAVQLAIKSISGNINEAWDGLTHISKLSQSEVANLINEAVAKSGPLPEKEGE